MRMPRFEVRTTSQRPVCQQRAAQPGACGLEAHTTARATQARARAGELRKRAAAVLEAMSGETRQAVVLSGPLLQSVMLTGR